MTRFWQGVHVASTIFLNIIVFGLVIKTEYHPFVGVKNRRETMSQEINTRKEYQIPSTNHCLWLFFKSVKISEHSLSDVDFEVVDRGKIALTTPYWMNKVELEVCFYCNVHILCQPLGIHPYFVMKLPEEVEVETTK